jgi:hypothetical protein
LGIVAALAWLLASLTAAAIAHALIGVAGAAGSGGDAYDEHAHAAVAPVTLAALGLLTGVLLRSAVHRVSRSQVVDPALLLARRFGAMHPLVPSLLVATGAFGALLGMEFTEQFAAFGRVEGVADALGGNAFAGLAIVGCVSAVITMTGLRSARALLTSAAATASALCAWILRRSTAVFGRSATVRRARGRRNRAASVAFAHSRGLRAPPATFG